MDKSTQIPPDSFAARLKQAMAMRNLKQETLAEAAGVSQNTIHKLTSGKAQSTRKLIEIAAALGVSPVWLQTGEGTPAARSAVSVADGSPLVLEPLHPWDSDTPLDEDEVELPLYKEVEMSAGAGRTAVREIEGASCVFLCHAACLGRRSVGGDLRPTHRQQHGTADHGWLHHRRGHRHHPYHRWRDLRPRT